MKVKCLVYIIIFFTFLSGEVTSVQAEGVLFPYPKGKVHITNGYDGSSTHKNKSLYSLDIRTYEKDDPCDSYGAPILAAKSGTVLKTKNADEDGAYGTYAIVKNSDDTSSWYAHMIKDTLAVNINDEVQQGQVLGLMGDTGNTSGMKCSAFDGENVGAHLHYEMRNADGSAYKPEPLIGEETYTGLSKAGNPYYSTSIMYDPSNHWDLYDGKVPYRLSYNPAQLESIHPLLAYAGSRTDFTITGTSLPDDVEVSIPGCNDVQWITKTDFEQQFSCEVAGDLADEEISNGTITSKTYGVIPFEFILKILSPEASFPIPKVHRVNADRKRPGELKTFTIQGENLPGDLLFQFPECTDQNFIMRSPDEQRVQCRIPRRVEDSEGKRTNDLHTFTFRLSDPRQDLQFESTTQEDYRIHISRVTPLEGAYGIPNTFTFVGDNVDLADAFFIERCGELREISRAQKRVKIQCTPLIRESFLNKFLPSLFNQRLHYFVVKDKPGGEKLIEGNILMQMTDKIYISGVVPARPILLEQNEFEITGAHLPESLLVWIPNCDGLKVYPKDHISGSIRFTCAPQLQDSSKSELDAINQKMTRLMGPLAQKPDLSEFEDYFEKQKRTVEIKLPKSISDIDENEKALLVSRKEISPISELYSKVLDQLEGYFPEDKGGDIDDKTKGGGQKDIDSSSYTASDEISYSSAKNDSSKVDALIGVSYEKRSEINDILIFDLSNRRKLYNESLLVLKESFVYKNAKYNPDVVSAVLEGKILYLFTIQHSYSSRDINETIFDYSAYDLDEYEVLHNKKFICPRGSDVDLEFLETSNSGRYLSYRGLDLGGDCPDILELIPDRMSKKQSLIIFDTTTREFQAQHFEWIYDASFIDDRSIGILQRGDIDSFESQLLRYDITSRSFNLLTSFKEKIPSKKVGFEFNNLKYVPNTQKFYFFAKDWKKETTANYGIEKQQDEYLVEYDSLSGKYSRITNQSGVESLNFFVDSTDLYYFEKYKQGQSISDIRYKLIKQNLALEEKTPTTDDIRQEELRFIHNNKDTHLFGYKTNYQFILNIKDGLEDEAGISYLNYELRTSPEYIHSFKEMSVPQESFVKISNVRLSTIQCQGNQNTYSILFDISNKRNFSSFGVKVYAFSIPEFYEDTFDYINNSKSFKMGTKNSQNELYFIKKLEPKEVRKGCLEFNKHAFPGEKSYAMFSYETQDEIRSFLDRNSVFVID
ncbi:MAG: M23 family metallopeptidase [Candidatus Altimarinota bacterium]